MKKLIVIVLSLCFIPSLVFGATVLTHTAGSIHYELSVLDGDYTFTDFLRVHSIEFDPGAAGEYVVLKYIDEDGERVVKLHSGDGTPRVKYFGKGRTKLMYDLSESSTSATGIISITVE